MSYIITWQSIFDEFVFMYPGLGSEVVDWYPSGKMQITMKLDDGAKLAYDYINKTFRFINSERADGVLSEEEWLREFSKNLSKKIDNSGLTQEEVSARTDISRTTLSKYINGKSAPTMLNVRKLAGALDCTISELTDFI